MADAQPPVPAAEPPAATSPAPAVLPAGRRLAAWVRPLNHQAYRLMWLGSTTSSLGDALTLIAVVFAVLHIGGTATEVVLVAAVQTVTRVVFLLAGGVWADRLRRQYVMLAADVIGRRARRRRAVRPGRARARYPRRAPHRRRRDPRAARALTG